MNSPLKKIGSRINAHCLASKIDKGGCSVGLRGAPAPFVVVDLDHPSSPVGPSSTKCDYIFFAEEGKAGLWAVPLELKSSAVNPNGVSLQLQAGAKIVEKIVRALSPVRFVPVVAHGRKVHRKQYHELAKRRISFRKERHAIKLMECGTPLDLDEA